MGYIIYKNVDEKAFDALKKKLNDIERISSPLMQMNSFYLDRRHYEDVLALDYLHEDEKFCGSIGLTYIDKEEPGDFHLFKFYIMKYYDKEDTRFYKRVAIEKEYTLDKIGADIYGLFNECLLVYESIKSDEIIETIKLRR